MAGKKHVEEKFWKISGSTNGWWLFIANQPDTLQKITISLLVNVDIPIFPKFKGLVGIHVRLTWFSSAAFWCSQRCVENKSTGDFSMVKRRHAGMNHRIFFGNSRMGIDHGTPKTALYNGKHTQNDGKIHHFYEVNQLFRLGHFQ